MTDDAITKQVWRRAIDTGDPHAMLMVIFSGWPDGVPYSLRIIYQARYTARIDAAVDAFGWIFYVDLFEDSGDGPLVRYGWPTVSHVEGQFLAIGELSGSAAGVELCRRLESLAAVAAG